MTLAEYMRKPGRNTNKLIRDVYYYSPDAKYVTLKLMLSIKHPELEYLASGIWGCIGIGRFSGELLQQIKDYHKGVRDGIITEIENLNTAGSIH